MAVDGEVVAVDGDAVGVDGDAVVFGAEVLVPPEHAASSVPEISKPTRTRIVAPAVNGEVSNLAEGSLPARTPRTYCAETRARQELGAQRAVAALDLARRRGRSVGRWTIPFSRQILPKSTSVGVSPKHRVWCSAHSARPLEISSAPSWLCQHTWATSSPTEARPSAPSKPHMA